VYATKDRIGVVVVMDRFRIEGYIHVPAGSRLTDALNSKAKDFFPLTEAKVYRLEDEVLLYSPSYLALNREFIGCLFPVEEA
jgi:hypothetical protein